MQAGRAPSPHEVRALREASELIRGVIARRAATDRDRIGE
jgi:hypothetical protein